MRNPGGKGLSRVHPAPFRKGRRERMNSEKPRLKSACPKEEPPPWSPKESLSPPGPGLRTKLGWASFNFPNFPLTGLGRSLLLSCTQTNLGSWFMAQYEDCIVFLLAKAYQRAHSAFKQKLAPFGITPVQQLILMLLGEEEFLSPAEISEKSRHGQCHALRCIGKNGRRGDDQARREPGGPSFHSGIPDRQGEEDAGGPCRAEDRPSMRN